MKKETKKKTKKVIEKVTLQKLANLIEKLAIFTVNGFERMESQMVTKEEFNKEINSLKQGQARLEHGQEGIKEEISSLKSEQKDTNRRVVSIERKLTGTQISLDETVHRSEFTRLEHRVKALES